jgi:hypothetical protein
MRYGMPFLGLAKRGAIHVKKRMGSSEATTRAGINV